MRSKALQAAQRRYDAKRPTNIAFRLTDEQERKLMAVAQQGESRNQTAKRLLLGVLDKKG